MQHFKRFMSLALTLLLLVLSCIPATVFATDADTSVAVNTTTGVKYDSLAAALAACGANETVALLQDASETGVSVYGDRTLDLNGYALTAEYMSCFGSLIDSSDDNSGVLKVTQTNFMIRNDNAQLPVHNGDGYRFVEMEKINISLITPYKIGFQPKFENSAVELLKQGIDVTGMTVQVQVKWKQDTGNRTQNFVYNDDLLLQYLNSYNASKNIYGKMFTLTLNNAEDFEELSFTAQIVSETGVSVSATVSQNGTDEENTGSDVTTDANNQVVNQVVIDNGNATAVIPVGTQLNSGTNKVTLSATEMDNTTSNVTLGTNEQMQSMNVHVEGVSVENTVPILVTLDNLAPEFLNQGNLKLYHVENGETVEMTRVYALADVDEHNEYYYDIATGTITVAMATFSEIAVVSDVDNAWNGNVDTEWYNDNDTTFLIYNADQLAGLGKLVDEGNTFDGKTILLGFNINLEGYKADGATRLSFDPIGYGYESDGGKVFKGTFDGNGHTIRNLYQNGWDLDLSYSTAGGGLFASVVDADFKNLIIDDAYVVMECIDMGALVGYAYGTCSFENIIVSNSVIANYNRYTGGVVGEVNGKHTFINVDVPNTTTISALWGTFDPGIGGIIGGKYGDATIYMERCDVASVLDVYNDVTSAYRWYSYRRCGMLIGYTEESQTVNGRTEATASFLTTVDCTVQYGDWAKYHYCEFTNEKYPYVRVEEGLFNDAYSNPRYGNPVGADGINKVNKENHDSGNAHKDGEDCQLPVYFHQLYGGGQGCYGGNGHIGAGVTELTNVEAESKFNGLLVNYANLIPGQTYTLGELFAATGLGEAIQNLSVNVYVSPVEMENVGKISGTYIRENDWTKSTLTLSGEGAATITINDYYYCVPTVIYVTLGKADPTYTVPTNLTAIYGQTLADVVLPDHFTWKDSTQSVGNAGVNTFVAIYTPADTANYNTVEVNISVTVGKADPTYTVPTNLTATYGQTLTDVVLPNRFTWKNSTQSVGNAGVNTFVAIYTPADTTNYNTVEVDVKVTVREPVEKFENKFTGDFLYRVGNGNTVALGSLFSDGADPNWPILSNHVAVSIERTNGTASGTYTADTSDWTKGSIQFSGTGVVKVTITDNDYCTPTVLNLEVVDAVNATSATSATSNNVVLLNNVNGAATITVSNGYAFYGNGFALNYTGDGSYRSAAVSYGFVTLDGGTLDNVQIKCKVFPQSYMYTIEMQAGSDGRYPYGYSAVVATNGSVISNSYIFGARNNVQIGSGNVTIENTVLECGSLANIHCKGTDADTVTLNNVTTIQYQTTSPFDTSKKVLGFGVLVGTNESTSNPNVKLTGDFKQYNWVTSDDASVSNTYAKTAINEALEVVEYQYTIGDKKTVNMGIVILNELDCSIVDERNNADSIPYQKQNITMSGKTGQVYSIAKGSNAITAESRYDATADKVIPYVPTKNNVIVPSVSYNDANGSVSLGTEFDAGKWNSILTVDLDNISGSTYTFTFSDLSIQKYGISLDFTVKDSSGNVVDKNTSITLNQLFTGEYTLYVVDNQIYDGQGTLTGETVTHEIPFVLKATKTSIEPPKFTNAGTATAIRLVDKKGGDWRPAYTVLTGITVTYWSASEGKVKTVDLSTLYNSGTISSNVWTYTCDDYTLTITGGQVHSDGTTITPVVANNTLYFASTNKAFGTGTTSRSIILTYVFTDKNDSTTWNRSETVTYSNLSEYDYNSFKNNGTLTEPSSGGGCVTPDTLITLADGSQKRVDELTGDELLLVWNLKTGKYDVAPIVFVDSEEEAEYEIVHLYFSDGSDVKIIYEHGFFDLDLGKYVYIDATNYADYVGHRFVTEGDIALGTWNVVTLDNAVVETEVTTAWSPVTFEHLCYYTNGVLSMPGGIAGLFNIFEVDTDTMSYNNEQMQQDIETYGLFTLEDFGGMITEEAFLAFNGAYLKVAMGKGLLTWEDIAYMAERYIPLM